MRRRKQFEFVFRLPPNQLEGHPLVSGFHTTCTKAFAIRPMSRRRGFIPPGARDGRVDLGGSARDRWRLVGGGEHCSLGAAIERPALVISAGQVVEQLRRGGLLALGAPKIVGLPPSGAEMHPQTRLTMQCREVSRVGGRFFQPTAPADRFAPWSP